MFYTDRWRVAANIKEYHIVSKLIFLRIIHGVYKIVSCFKWTYGLIGHNYRNATLYTMYLDYIRNHHTEFKFDRTLLDYKLLSCFAF